jgi:hypothetical protein
MFPSHAHRLGGLAVAEKYDRIGNSRWGLSMLRKRAGNPRIRQTAHVKTREWVARWQQAKELGCTWQDFWFYKGWPPVLLNAMKNDEPKRDGRPWR